MSRQVLNTCVSSGMEYLATIYGKNKKSSKFEKHYHTQFGVFLPIEGVDYANMTSFVNHFFETNSFIGITQAIDAGHFVICLLYTSPSPRDRG